MKRFFIILNIALLVVSNFNFVWAASCQTARGAQGDAQATHACCRAKHGSIAVTTHHKTEKLCGKLPTHVFNLSAFSATQNAPAIERPSISCHCLSRSNLPPAPLAFFFDAQKVKRDADKLAPQISSTLFTALANNLPPIASKQHAPPIRDLSVERISNCVFRI